MLSLASRTWKDLVFNFCEVLLLVSPHLLLCTPLSGLRLSDSSAPRTLEHARHPYHRSPSPSLPKLRLHQLSWPRLGAGPSACPSQSRPIQQLRTQSRPTPPEWQCAR